MNTNLATENSSGVEFRVIHVDFHVNLIFLVDFEIGFTGLYDENCKFTLDLEIGYNGTFLA